MTRSSLALLLGLLSLFAACQAPTSSASTPAPTPLFAPSSVVFAGNAQASLTWVSPSGATSCNLYWSTTPGVTVASATKVTSVTSPYNLTGLTNGSTYYYVLTSVGATGESTPSSESSFTPVQLSAANLTGVWKQTLPVTTTRLSGTLFIVSAKVYSDQTYTFTATTYQSIVGSTYVPDQYLSGGPSTSYGSSGSSGTYTVTGDQITLVETSFGSASSISQIPTLVWTSRGTNTVTTTRTPVIFSGSYLYGLNDNSTAKAQPGVSGLVGTWYNDYSNNSVASTPSYQRRALTFDGTTFQDLRYSGTSATFTTPSSTSTYTYTDSGTGKLTYGSSTSASVTSAFVLINGSIILGSGNALLGLAKQ